MAYDRQLSAQTDVWRGEAFESRLSTMSMDIVDEPIGSTERAEAIMDLGAVLDDEAMRLGWDAETRKAKGMAVMSGVHEATIGGLLSDGRADEARTYLNEHFDQVLPGPRNTIVAKVEDAYLDFQADSAVRGDFIVDEEPEIDVPSPVAGGPVQKVRLGQPVSAAVGSRFGPRPTHGGGR